MDAQGLGNLARADRAAPHAAVRPGESQDSSSLCSSSPADLSSTELIYIEPQALQSADSWVERDLEVGSLTMLCVFDPLPIVLD
jgi:hypothetical protein